METRQEFKTLIQKPLLTLRKEDNINTKLKKEGCLDGQLIELV